MRDALRVTLVPRSRSVSPWEKIADAGVPEDRNAYEDRQFPTQGFPPAALAPLRFIISIRAEFTIGLYLGSAFDVRTKSEI